MLPIPTAYMRLALVLRDAMSSDPLGDPAIEDEIVSDAKELILANRKLQRIGPCPEATEIMRRVDRILAPYGIRAECLYGGLPTLVVNLANGTDYAVPV